MKDRSRAAHEAEIRQLVEASVQAVRARDVDASTAYYAREILLFDVVNLLQSTGLDAVKERLATWFSMFQGPIDFETRDLSIAADVDVAFCHSLNQIDATLLSGEQLQMWWRATLCFQKIDGDWKVTHAHSSVPMDVTSGKASVDLVP